MLTVRPSAIGDLRAQLASLEREFEARRAEVEAFQQALEQLQGRYLSELGRYYAELTAIQTAIEEAEVRLGLRPPIDPAGLDADEEQGVGCSNRSEPSVDLKRMFRDIAKAIHPDKAGNKAARDRRHSLMAEANRAYAERDGDRLLFILRSWERSPEAVPGDTPEAARIRVERRIAELKEQLLELDIEMADLNRSAIARLKARSDEAAAQGWDLFAEMRRQVKREILTAKFRLTGLS